MRQGKTRCPALGLVTAALSATALGGFAGVAGAAASGDTATASGDTAVAGGQLAVSVLARGLTSPST